MYCSVCGKDDRFHKETKWGLFKKNEKGKYEQTHPTIVTGKCAAIRFFQSFLIAGMGNLRKI